MRVLVPLLLFASTTAALGGTLTVDVQGVPDSQGSVRAALFDGPSGFPSKKAAKAFTSAKAAQGRIELSFADLPAGRYAIVAFQDSNDNKVLDRNFLGKPTEGLGFSNGAKPNFGPPPFENAAFAFDGKMQTVTIRLNY